MSNNVTDRKCAGRGSRPSTRANVFSAKKRQAFLDALALTCNVEAAAAHAGVHRTTPYVCRGREPQFARQWQDALAAGYDRLEMLVLEHGGAGVALAPADPHRAEDAGALAPPPFDFDKALRVLALYRRQRHDLPGRRSGAPRRRATREETNAALIRALTAAKKRLERAGDA